MKGVCGGGWFFVATVFCEFAAGSLEMGCRIAVGQRSARAC